MLDKKTELKKDFRFKILQFVYFIIYLCILIFLIVNIITYGKENTYEDKDVIIKEMPLGYNVYYKNGNLKEVNFFDGNFINNENILSYINENLLFTEGKTIDDTNIIILKNPTNGSNKTELDKIDDIYIKKIAKLDNVHYLVLFIEKKENKYNYCFMENTLDFTDDDNKYCIKSSSKKINFAFARYKDYYAIGINDKIYFFNPILKEIHMIINVNSKIIDISKNPNYDLKLIHSNGVEKMSNIYIDYYLIKRITDNKKVKIIDISKIL